MVPDINLRKGGSMKPTWIRAFPNSANNFDLVLENPDVLDPTQIKEFLADILKETHRGLTLSARASKEFRRWLDHPNTPLKSEAYVLLSNWFMTQSGDRHSTIATRCEDLWDALFPCRPEDRLSSPEPGRNHVMIPNEFQKFWRRTLEAQGEKVHAVGEAPAYPKIDGSPRTAMLVGIGESETTER